MRQSTSADLIRFILVGAVGVAAGLFPFAVRFGIVPDWRVCLVVAWLLSCRKSAASPRNTAVDVGGQHELTGSAASA